MLSSIVEGESHITITGHIPNHTMSRGVSHALKQPLRAAEPIPGLDAAA